MAIDVIFQIAVLIMSVVIHEVSHGYVANSLGDPTARLEGRLSLNPIRHLDPFGSILVPIVTSLSGFTFGWAKPVPYNPYNLRNGRRGEVMVALAGPLSNIIIALFFGLLIRFMAAGDFANMGAFGQIAAIITITNLVLAIFNLVPIPPLDGSKILFGILPETQIGPFRAFLERYGFALVLVFIFFLWQFVSPLIGFLFALLTGLHF